VAAAVNRPYSAACERNRAPILAVLRTVFARATRVLEIGSGTGQHAVYFGAALPHLVWQCSDRAQHLPGIRAWLDEARLDNVPPPLELEVNEAVWPQRAHDAAFSANTAHIMSWAEVERMYAGLAQALEARAPFCLYGPFHIGGQPTSESNARFDAMLRVEAAHMGVRDLEAVCELARRSGFDFEADHALPANNRLLVFRRAG
jgi:hypothetical protein